MSKSVKVNYIFNLVNTISGVLFPLITFPYASRVMMADGIGHVNFYSSIIQYITLLSCLGIPMYAIREIAKVRDDRALRDKTAIEILLLHTMLTILGYVGVAVIAATVAEVQVDIPLFLILSLTIFFTAIGCEWFYQGVEDFKYITIRGLIVKVVSVVLLFVLVKTKDDLYWYAGYTVFGVLGGNIFNFFRLRRYISLKAINIKELRPLRHLLPALHIFALNLVISIYIQLNSIMLGFMSGDTAVGLFTAANKISHILLGFSGALSTALLPRMSNLAASNDKVKFRQMYRKSMRFIVGLSLPLMIGLIITAPILIPLFAGETYQNAIVTLQLLAPTVLIISMSGVAGIQTLYPMGKVNLVILTTGIGAIVNFILNLWFIPLYSQDGAAMSTTIAEIAVTGSMLFVARKHVSYKFKSHSYFCYFMASFIMLACLFPLKDVNMDNIIKLLAIFIVGIMSYAVTLFLTREELFMGIVESVRTKLKNE